MPSRRPLSGQLPRSAPYTAGTRLLPAAERASWVVTSGLSPWCRTRNTFTMTCSPASVSQMTEVFDCSPESTRAAVTVPIGRSDSGSASIRAASPRTQSRSPVASVTVPSRTTTGAW